MPKLKRRRTSPRDQRKELPQSRHILPQKRRQLKQDRPQPLLERPGRFEEIFDQIPRVLSGLGTSILSTSQGLMTDSEARRRKVGGELLCEVW